MKCLTIQQPYADLIVHGAKDIENRSWSTRYRGPLAIHAGLTVDRDMLRELRRACREQGIPCPPAHTGAIVGIVDLVDIVTESDSEWFTGPYGWVLTNPRVAEKPLPYRGRIGLYDVPDELVREE
jgi:hypothetical protein